jgi:alpha-glucosidase
MLRLRMRLLPYLYGLFDEAARTGAPVLRPLLFEHPDDETTYTADDEFLLGDALLVAPITRPGIEHRHVYLPAGTWVHWWTGEVIEGPAHLLAHAPLGRPALYARANAAIPLWPAREHVGPVDRLTLRVFLVPGAAAVTRGLYEDAGDGYGECARRTATVDGLTVSLSARDGGYVAPPRVVELELLGVDVASVTVDGAPREVAERDGAAVVEVGEDACEVVLMPRPS